MATHGVHEVVEHGDADTRPTRTRRRHVTTPLVRLRVIPETHNCTVKMVQHSGVSLRVVPETYIRTVKRVVHSGGEPEGHT